MNFIGDLYVYQIGNWANNFHVFNRGDLKLTFEGFTPKKNIQQNPNGDGNIDTRGALPDFKDGATVTIDYTLYETNKQGGATLWSNNDPYTIQTILYTGVFPIFFIRELPDNTFEFLWTYAKLNVPPRKATNTQGDDNQITHKYQMKLWLMTPYLFRDNSNDLGYVDVNIYNANTLKYGSSIKYGSGAKYGAYTASFLNFSSITNLDLKRTYFVEYDYPLYPLRLNDRYFRRQTAEGVRTTTLSSTGVESTTLSTNNPTTYILSNINQRGNASQFLYSLEVGSLAFGESIQIVNNLTKSELKITWNDITASTTLYYTSYAKNTLFDNLGNRINVEKYFITQENRDYDNLYFSTAIGNNLYISGGGDVLTLTKNTSTNLTIKINSLTVFH